MKMKVFNNAQNYQNPKISKEGPSMCQVAKGLFLAGVLALAIGSFVPEEETTYYFNGPEMQDATLEDGTYTITFEDNSVAKVTKEELANEDLGYFGYNTYPLNGHQCSVTPRQEVGNKDIINILGFTALAGGVIATTENLSQKRKNRKNNKKEQEQQKRKQYAKQRVAKRIYNN